MVYAGTSDGYRFLALDAKTERLKFTLDAKGAVFSSPALAGDYVYGVLSSVLRGCNLVFTSRR